MSALSGFLLAVAGLLLVAAVAYAVMAAWRKAAYDDAPLPFFSMFRRWGKTPHGLETAPDAEDLALAVRRCTFCGDKEQCRARLAADSAAQPPPSCPNLRLFEEPAPPPDQVRK